MSVSLGKLSVWSKVPVTGDLDIVITIFIFLQSRLESVRNCKLHDKLQKTAIAKNYNKDYRFIRLPATGHSLKHTHDILHSKNCDWI